MLIEVPSTKAVNITHVRVELPVRYDDQDIPFDFPLRDGDMWRATINLDTGVIEEWPKYNSGVLYMKVCDSGLYRLLDGDQVLAEIQDYVPHGVIPGEYGDYVNLEINSDGKIENWADNIDVSEFFPET